MYWLIMIAEFLLFQFHKGTIRTREWEERRYQASYFNSIKVQLEPGFSFKFDDTSNYFNSIKVQLELYVD